MAPLLPMRAPTAVSRSLPSMKPSAASAYLQDVHATLLDRVYTCIRTAQHLALAVAMPWPAVLEQMTGGAPRVGVEQGDDDRHVGAADGRCHVRPQAAAERSCRHQRSLRKQCCLLKRGR
jgi:hypothetical protein